MRKIPILLLIFLPILVSPTLASAKTWLVGPTRQYTAPSTVQNLVGDGDTVLVDSGTYIGDVATWNANNLVLRCPDGMARFNANGNIAGDKGIWVIYGGNTYVEGFEFYGAAIDSADGDNGAGIRVQGNNFTCRRCYFHDNQEGILTGNDTTANDIWIESCEFDHNGVETGGLAGYEHNIYVGHSTSCTIQFCYFHRSVVGHEIKTRANRNYILYNYIVDDTDGDGSYSIDVPNGGLTCIVGNAIEKGPNTENSTVISYGEEGIINGDSEFFFVSNTIVTDRNPTTFFNIAPVYGESPLIADNIFAGPAHPFPTNNWYLRSNVVSTDTSFFHFRDPIHFDYHPIANFTGLYSAQYFAYQGNEPVIQNAEWEYVNPMDSASRTYDNEVGAFEAVYPDTLSDSIIIYQNFQNTMCIGDTDWEHIWIKNTGNAGYLYGWSIYGPNESDYDIFGGSGKFIAPDEIDSLIVRFIPSVNGVETDTLRIDGGTEHYVLLQERGGSAIIAGSDTTSSPVGEIDTFSVTICNTGTCDWTPGNPIASPPFVYLNGGDTMIAPGECVNLVFAFAPTSGGSFTQHVTFPNASGISMPQPSVTITGTTTTDAVAQVSAQKFIPENFPNPFSSSTLFPNISGSLRLFNACGVEMNAASSQTDDGILLERGPLPAGIYFYRISQTTGIIAEGSVVIEH